jgi:hypothetical protein
VSLQIYSPGKIVSMNRESLRRFADLDKVWLRYLERADDWRGGGFLALGLSPLD